MEKICGFVYIISQILLQELGKDTEEIGLKDIGKKMFPPAKIIGEMSAYNTNHEIFIELIAFFETSCRAFDILEKKSVRQVFKRKTFIDRKSVV